MDHRCGREAQQRLVHDAACARILTHNRSSSQQYRRSPDGHGEDGHDLLAVGLGHDVTVTYGGQEGGLGVGDQGEETDCLELEPTRGRRTDSLSWKADAGPRLPHCGRGHTGW